MPAPATAPPPTRAPFLVGGALLGTLLVLVVAFAATAGGPLHAGAASIAAILLGLGVAAVADKSYPFAQRFVAATTVFLVLFLVAAVAPKSLPTLIAAMLLGLIPAAIARHKGFNPYAWWAFGAALFIVALPIAIVMRPNSARVDAGLRAGDGPVLAGVFATARRLWASRPHFVIAVLACTLVVLVGGAPFALGGLRALGERGRAEVTSPGHVTGAGQRWRGILLPPGATVVEESVTTNGAYPRLTLRMVEPPATAIKETERMWGTDGKTWVTNEYGTPQNGVQVYTDYWADPNGAQRWSFTLDMPVPLTVTYCSDCKTEVQIVALYR